MDKLTHISARFAYIHPAIFALCVLCFIALSVLLVVGFNVLSGFVFIFNFIHGPLWSHGIYSASVLAKGDVARCHPIFISSEAVCLLTAASFFTAPVPEGEILADISKYLAYGFIGLQFLAWWIAARTFVSVPRGDEAPRWLSNTAGIYWLIWVAPIGAWVLRPHIRDLGR